MLILSFFCIISKFCRDRSVFFRLFRPEIGFPEICPVFRFFRDQRFLAGQMFCLFEFFQSRNTDIFTLDTLVMRVLEQEFVVSVCHDNRDFWVRFATFLKAMHIVFSEDKLFNATVWCHGRTSNDLNTECIMIFSKREPREVNRWRIRLRGVSLFEQRVPMMLLFGESRAIFACTFSSSTFPSSS